MEHLSAVMLFEMWPIHKNQQEIFACAFSLSTMMQHFDSQELKKVTREKHICIENIWTDR